MKISDIKIKIFTMQKQNSDFQYWITYLHYQINAIIILL